MDILNIPPDLKIPKGMPLIPLEWRLRIKIGRVLLHIANAVQPASKKEENLRKFDDLCKGAVLEVLARRLALHEVRERFGRANIDFCKRRKFAADDATVSAEVLQMNAVYTSLLDEYRRRVNSPKADRAVNALSCG